MKLEFSKTQSLTTTDACAMLLALLTQRRRPKLSHHTNFEKFTDWLQHDVDHYKVKGSTCQLSPKYSIRFALRPALFEMQSRISKDVFSQMVTCSKMEKKKKKKKRKCNTWMIATFPQILAVLHSRFPRKGVSCVNSENAWTPAL